MEKPHADCPDDCVAPGNGPQAHVKNPNCIWRDDVRSSVVREEGSSDN